MLFVTMERLAPVLFALAILARALIVAVLAHWACIGVAFAMGLSPDRVVPITSLAVVLLVLTAFGSLWSIRNRQPGGKERMAAGPRKIAAWRAFVLAFGAASQLSGVFLYASGSLQAGGWAMGIGTTMVFFEIAAICGAGMIPEDLSGGDLE